MSSNKRLFIYTLSRDRFKCDFVKTIESEGIERCHIPLLFRISILQKIGVRFRCFFRYVKKNDKAIIVASNGYLLLHESLPYNFYCEIIPFLWDCWPSSWNQLEKTLRLLSVNICFVTSIQVQTEFQRRMPKVHFIYIPEAVRKERFYKGLELCNRKTNIFEMGRKHPVYHNVLMKLKDLDDSIQMVDHVNDLYAQLAESQIVISFPRCDTHPEMAGVVETLTERYWEAMLSRCLIVGHAPFELLQLCGYNPIVEVDFQDPQNQLLTILHNLNSYQTLVNRNYEVALRKGDWRVRSKEILWHLQTAGYKVSCP